MKNRRQKLSVGVIAVFLVMVAGIFAAIGLIKYAIDPHTGFGATGREVKDEKDTQPPPRVILVNPGKPLIPAR